MSEERPEVEILRDLVDAQRRALENAEKLIAADHEVIERQRAEIAKAGELVEALENANAVLERQIRLLDTAIKKLLGDETPQTPEVPN